MELFSTEIANTDFWWHLKSGQYISETHSLPDPDPFAFTTVRAANAYAGEPVTRRFNLTHEWLSQTLMYLAWKAAGLTGVILVRALLLTTFCATVGLIAYLRCKGFYRALLASLLAACIVRPFAADRPYLVTFVCLGATLLAFESANRFLLWLLPLLMLVWANSHGGFILGWVAIGAYLAESAFRHFKGRSDKGEMRLWILSGASLVMTAMNPNGLNVFLVLAHYRRSFLTSTLMEWQPPVLWPPTILDVLVLATLITLLLAFRKVRMVDWLLFGLFTIAALVAGRNTFLIGFLAPVLIVAYLPWKTDMKLSGIGEIAVWIPVAAGFALILAATPGFQLYIADWKLPSGAADFLLSHHVTGRMFNTYEYGGYLQWRLWPRMRVFIDGRSLSESVFRDYGRILYNADERDGKSASELLDEYGVDIVVMNSFEYTSGLVYVLAPALVDPGTFGWHLVYADSKAMIFFRHPPDGIQVLNPSLVLSTLESECYVHVRHEPWFPGCARNLGEMFSHTGDVANARLWLGEYLARSSAKDPEAEADFQKASLGR